jgi:hypothetical protein
VWQIHFLGVLGHFLSHDRFRAKVRNKLQNHVLATLRNDLATQNNDLATLFMARSFFGVARSFLWCVRSFLTT